MALIRDVQVALEEHMRNLLSATLVVGMALPGLAQTAATPAAPVPAAPAPGTVKWRGAIWASAATSSQETADGSLFLRPMDAGNNQLTLDGLQLGADVTLADGFSLTFTLLAGQDGRAINLATLGSNGQPTDSSSIAWPEAQLIWTGSADSVKIGRMYTPMGMEVVDHTQDITASRGLLFTYADPFAQVGVNWHHAFSTVWSADFWAYNGEDRIQSNHQGKTLGLGLTYNPTGASDKFVTLMAFSGPEQTSIGSNAIAGAEGRKRTRLSLAGQWVWGNTTLVFEGESANEAMANGAPRAKWAGAGLIGKYQFNPRWAGFVRFERLKDDTCMRLSGDPSVASAITVGANAGLSATSCAVGAERKWHATFTRLEARADKLNQDVFQGPKNSQPFRSAISATWSIGTRF